jgi:hypothetical protein
MFQAPVHFLVIPRKPIAMLDEVGGIFFNIYECRSNSNGKCYGTYLLKLDQRIIVSHVVQIPVFSPFGTEFFSVRIRIQIKISQRASGSRAGIKFKNCYKVKIKVPFCSTCV